MNIVLDVSTIAAQVLISLHPMVTDANIAPPRTVAVEPAVLQEYVCGRPCRVRAWYSPAGTIFLDKRLNVESNLGAKSILVHELVHHVQRMRYGGRAKNCQDWLQREKAAYRIQADWLRSKGLKAGTLTRHARSLRCADTSSQLNSAP